MWLLSSLAHRHREPEIQDQLDLDIELLRQALTGLESINSWSRSLYVLWPSIRSLGRQMKRPLRVLDIATGAADVPISLWHLAQLEKLALQVEACDLNPRTVSYAQHRVREKRADVHVFQLDVLHQEIPHHYDVVMCSLFLHHLSDAEAVMVLGRMAQAAEYMLLVSDLLRGVEGLVLAYLCVPLLTTSRVNRVDSVRSVRAAFTLDEVRFLVTRAGLSGAVVEKRWPCRYLLKWAR
ncbi:MAG TPA: methyltransferase domain-containing protein [Gemmataceae bacterium]|nr:methyltransferase domain-containing protein [Gemmataceae bacterium]